ncbi:hypothetical protein ACQP1V_36340 [Microtetraspora malaysiensis]|uniref:hypothetical protein n=1 Tax=Microtetraspora malaysiensis TaxID=161358 RepID=UPI003D8E0F48
MSFGFSQPSAGSDWKAADHVGHLILFYVREIRENIVTTFGNSDAIAVDLVVLTDPSGPRAEPQVLLFQKALIGSLRGSIGKEPVLARLGQGTAKAGQSAPYILQPYSEQDAAYATTYLQSVGGNPFQTAPSFQQAPVPQTAPAAPAPAPLPQTPAAPAPAAAPTLAAPAAGVITLPNGQQVTPETAAALAQLGMSMPPAPPAA